MQITLAHDNPKGRVEHQKGSYQSGLIPKEKCIKHGVFNWRCGHGKRYVMDVNDNAFVQARQDLEKEELDITVFLTDMT
jgi:hypothetical protein